MFRRRKPVEVLAAPLAAHAPALPVHHVIPPPAKQKPAKRLEHFDLRRGMWVRTPEGVGIAREVATQPANATAHIPEEHFIDVMLVHEDGTNKLHVFKKPHEVVQADYADIPNSRKDHAPREHFASLGY